MIRRFLVLLVALLALGCTDAAKQIQVQTAEATAAGANAGLPLLVERYRAKGLEIIAKAETRDEAETKLAVLDAEWAPVWGAWEGLRVAQDAWATALEEGGDLGGALKAMKVAYCELRETWPDDIPAIPLVPVKCAPASPPVEENR